MADFNVRSDSVNVEQIMEQIRERIREKRGSDYTEQQIRELAAVKLERFLDPRGVRSDLLEQFRRARPPYSPPDLPNYVFEEDTLFTSHRSLLRWMRRLLRPILKLFFNPNPLIQVLHIQSRLNAMNAEREARREAARHATDQLHYEVLHNLVVETTRIGIEMKNLKMRVESLTSRLEFNERRARALESVVLYKPEADEGGPQRPPAPSDDMAPAAEGRPGGVATGGEGPGQRSRRRRRRRGRRSGASAASVMEGRTGAGSGHVDVQKSPAEEGAQSPTRSPSTDTSATPAHETEHSREAGAESSKTPSTAAEADARAPDPTEGSDPDPQ